jgi:NAD(P)-dependent dehydrogenase (short-subunit alcohol dehydrogenase family)
MKYSINKNFALITGATGLLGPFHAESLAEIGYNIILLDLKIKKLKVLEQRLKRKFKKTKILYYKCDISSNKEIDNLNTYFTKKKIYIDCLINNADINPKMNPKNKTISSRIETYSVEKLEKELSVGIIGTFNCCKYFGSEMAKRKKGIIVNVSSDLGIIAPDQRIYDKSENINKIKNFKPIGYSISKHGMHGITKYLATYWGHKNVRCNTLVLGSVLNNQPSYLINNIKKRVPLNRMANKLEYKKAIQFLASKENSYMTGQTLVVDGGRTIW